MDGKNDDEDISMSNKNLKWLLSSIVGGVGAITIVVLCFLKSVVPSKSKDRKKDSSKVSNREAGENIVVDSATLGNLSREEVDAALGEAIEDSAGRLGMSREEVLDVLKEVKDIEKVKLILIDKDRNEKIVIVKNFLDIVRVLDEVNMGNASSTVTAIAKKGTDGVAWVTKAVIVFFADSIVITVGFFKDIVKRHKEKKAEEPNRNKTNTTLKEISDDVHTINRMVASTYDEIQESMEEMLGKDFELKSKERKLTKIHIDLLIESKKTKQGFFSRLWDVVTVNEERDRDMHSGAYQNTDSMRKREKEISELIDGIVALETGIKE